MTEKPTPPAELPSGLTDECRSLSATQLRELARYAEALAEYTERQAQQEETNDAESTERPDGVPAGASVTVKTINENRYRYWQWRDGDKIKSKYIGPTDADE